MKLIFKIAKNEWRYLFYSPIAWFISIVFLIQCAYFYTNPVYDFANMQDILIKNDPKFTTLKEFLTSNIFIGGGVFSNVMRNLYLFIPLLTMGLINREVNNGSVKLLYSAPVKLRQIVIGKYLGIILYCMLLVLLLGIFIITGFFNIKHVDYGMLLSAALGFYLLVCAYSAIGLFMSSLTTYQVVSALSTFAIIFILGYIGSLWQRYDFVRDLTYFLSLQNRTNKMLVGLITTKDVIYFIVVAGMFVGFTLIKLKAGREARPWYIKAGRYIAVFAATLLIGYISSRPALTGYLDTTATKSNTIPVQMQKIMKELGDSALEVTLYTNLFANDFGHGLPEARNLDYMANFWEPYLRFKPDITFKYEYYYDKAPGEANNNFLQQSSPGTTLQQEAKDVADMIDAPLSMFKSPEQMHKTIDLQQENYQVVMQLKYRGRTEFLRTYPSPDPFFWPDVTNMSAGFKRLLHPSTIPKVYFVSGELERGVYKTGEREYAVHTALKASRAALVNIGFDVDSLNLATQDIPSDITALVLADPKMELSPVVQNKLKRYTAAGGNMFILGEPGKQYVLNPFLKQLSVELINGQLVRPGYDETPDKVQSYLTAIGSGLYEELSEIKKGLESGTDTLKILMPGVTGISNAEDRPEDKDKVEVKIKVEDKDEVKDNAFTIAPLLMTTPGRAWLKAGNLIIDSTLPPFNPEQGDIKENAFSTGLQLTRQVNNKQQRIVICGDADFASNMRLATSMRFLMPVYSWMAYNAYPVYMTSIPPKDTILRISAAGASAQKIIYVWVLPGLVLLIGTVLLIRRKRK